MSAYLYILLSAVILKSITWSSTALFADTLISLYLDQLPNIFYSAIGSDPKTFLTVKHCRKRCMAVFNLLEVYCNYTEGAWWYIESGNLQSLDVLSP